CVAKIHRARAEVKILPVKYGEKFAAAFLQKEAAPHGSGRLPEQLPGLLLFVELGAVRRKTGPDAAAKFAVAMNQQRGHCAAIIALRRARLQQRLPAPRPLLVEARAARTGLQG